MSSTDRLCASRCVGRIHTKTRQHEWGDWFLSKLEMYPNIFSPARQIPCADRRVVSLASERTKHARARSLIKGFSVLILWFGVKRSSQLWAWPGTAVNFADRRIFAGSRFQNSLSARTDSRAIRGEFQWPHCDRDSDPMEEKDDEVTIIGIFGISLLL